MSVSIVSFPPALRNILHVGLHVVALDAGNRAAADALSCELLDLWEIGIDAQCQNYQVAVVLIPMDTRGYEFLRGQQGGGAYHGCYECKDKIGKHVLERMVYPFARRFLSNKDPKRQISKAPYNPAIPYHVEAERKAKPEFLSYNEYLHFCDQSAAHPKKEAVNGCKKKWSFHILPYAHKIVIFTDGMHVFGNVIGDSLNLFRPGNVNKENRSASATVLQYERSNGRFLGGFLFFPLPC
jgi:hypothetical protein